MSDRNLILTLAKVIIAAAWADGEITTEEINSIKDLIFRLPYVRDKQNKQISTRDWAMLEMYLESPVDEIERARLVEQLQSALRAPQDRKMALMALENLVQADGVVTEEELAVTQEIQAALDSMDLGIFTQLSRLIRGPVQRRSQTVAGAPLREEQLEDFIKNKVYYAVRQRLNLGANDLNLPDAELRKLSLAGGLMARVAHVDQKVTDDEFGVMVKALQANWGLEREAAAIVAEVALSKVSADLDYFRLSREFVTSTTEQERIQFLDVLLAVASADGQISHHENEEIRGIAQSLKLSHKQFADAKLRLLQ